MTTTNSPGRGRVLVARSARRVVERVRQRSCMVRRVFNLTPLVAPKSAPRPMPLVDLLRMLQQGCAEFRHSVEMAGVPRSHWYGRGADEWEHDGRHRAVPSRAHAPSAEARRWNHWSVS